MKDGIIRFLKTLPWIIFGLALMAICSYFIYDLIATAEKPILEIITGVLGMLCGIAAGGFLIYSQIEGLFDKT